ncbi:MAG: LacI family DNA-binding transcriptional regulator [Nocardioidaceae bacterium]
MTLDSRATLVGVATHAGVSVASASRVLNGLPSSRSMVEKVQASASALGYRPNVIARSLKVQHTDQLAFAMSDVGNPVYVTMMRAVEEATRDEGYRLMISSIASDPGAVVELMRSLRHGYADGLVLSPLRVTDALLAELHTPAVPTVVIGTVPSTVPVDNVRANSAGAVRIALDHLSSVGRRRVAFLNGPVDTVPGSARARAFERNVRRLGLAVDDRLRVEADDFTLRAGRAAAVALLERGQPDAVLGGNDLLAIASMQVLRESGIRVPEDVAVIGMDDTELATVTTPTLTSVSLGSYRRGHLAAQLLLERLREPDRPVRRVTVQPELHARASTALLQARR